MRLERDSIPLDKEFPFQISEVEAYPSNSHREPGWHSYLSHLGSGRKGKLFRQWTGIYHGRE